MAVVLNSYISNDERNYLNGNDCGHKDSFDLHDRVEKVFANKNINMKELLGNLKIVDTNSSWDAMTALKPGVDGTTYTYQRRSEKMCGELYKHEIGNFGWFANINGEITNIRIGSLPYVVYDKAPIINVKYYYFHHDLEYFLLLNL